ncbi:HlyD family efflux transporter periplasmic adaptor subunit [Pleurocapsa sp. PCC 7319]|uniref:HlyD family efflux transporter periplasmic adaptor subunit n=1 Tax=Pleurocapsa sp. PCC 7319 TaxID=118161 RepID=UPI00034A5323|nr:HlyD family efflux transporter periplasmic adaptor subunit [Pleurocapsa sp. PCC 7319]
MVNGKFPANSKDTAILPVKKRITGSKIKILLVGDSNSFGETLRNYLVHQPDFAIVGSVIDAGAALKQVENLNPNIVLMDLEIPGIQGLEATTAIAQDFPQSKTIVLSDSATELHLKKALHAGAKGYLLKTTSAEELIYGIRFVNQGYLHFSPGLFEKLESVETVILPTRQGATSSSTSLTESKPSASQSQPVSTAQTPSVTPSSSEIVLAHSTQIQLHDWSSQTKELIDNLPKVWTRGLLYFLAVFTAIALPWAMLSQVDETGTARGRLEPSGKTFILDAPVAGTVAAINIKAGEPVEAGQSLLELESDLVSAELQQLQTQLTGQQNKLNQLELLKKQLLVTVNTQEQESQAQKLEKQAQIAQARQQLQFYQKSYNSQQEEKLAQVNQAKQNVVYSQTALNSAQAILTKAQTEIDRYRQALKQGIIAEVQVVEQEDIIAERQQAFDQAQSDFQQAQLRLAEQENSYAQVVRQAESDIEQAQLQLQEQEKSDRTLTHTGKLAILRSQEQLNNIETEIATLIAEIAQSESQIASIQYQLKQRVLKAPVKGTVFNLAIAKAGEVVQPGEAIAEIAPEDSPLVVMAQMATAESGSLTKGMPVKLKFDAYPFQDYGIVTGELADISPTSELIDTEQGQVANYNLEIKLDRDCLPAASKCIALRPGDTATAEVVVRQRRIIDFILDPFKKLQQGGLEL